MPTKREREYYAMGFRDAMRMAERQPEAPSGFLDATEGTFDPKRGYSVRKPKRKLSAWNKFVKANSKKPRFRLRSGSPNLKKLGVAFRKTPAGKKKRR